MYIETQLTPRFCDTDAAGHINNTAVAQWLEAGRTDLYFNRMTDPVECMMRRLEVDYDREMTHTLQAIIRTGIIKLGTKSITLRQEIWQADVRRAVAIVVDCWFDPATRGAAPIPDYFRAQHGRWLFDEPQPANTWG